MDPGKKGRAALRVMVYIHGGGLRVGSAREAVYDGEELARKGIVVVTLNYRLGILGFFAHPGLTKESRYHASGGAFSVTAQVVSPLSKGLFRAAIVESGIVGSGFARKAGLADRRVYDLRSTFANRANVCHATGMSVAHLLGHASTQILPTYIRPFDENTRALMAGVDAASNC